MLITGVSTISRYYFVVHPVIPVHVTEPYYNLG